MTGDDIDEIPAPSGSVSNDPPIDETPVSAPPNNAEAIEPGVYGDTVPFEKRFLGNVATVASGVEAPKLLVSLAKLGVQGGRILFNKLLGGTLDTAQGAEALRSTDTALQAGLGAKGGLAEEKAAQTATKNALYGAIPKDVQVPLSGLQNEADSIITELKDLPKPDQPAKIRLLASAYQDLDKTSYGAASVIRSNLSDLATNGEGAEKMYAARLGKALQKDMESFGTASATTPISQGRSLEAQSLRSLWGDTAMKQSGTDPGDVLSYVRPDVAQSGTPALTNADISQKTNRANSYFRDMIELRNHPLTRALSNARPEDMSDLVFRGGRVQDVNVAKAVLGDVGYGGLQKQFYGDLLDAKNIGKTMAKYTPEFLQSALSPQQISALQAVDKIKSLAQTGKTAAKIGAYGIGLGGAVQIGEKLAR